MNNNPLVRWWRRLAVTAPPDGAVLISVKVTRDDGTRHGYLYVTPDDRFTFGMGLLIESIADELHLDEHQENP